MVSSVATGGSSQRLAMSVTKALNAATSPRMRPGVGVVVCQSCCHYFSTTFSSSRVTSQIASGAKITDTTVRSVSGRQGQPEMDRA